jgi:type IV secretion/conjugal transfer VirB4 family ATPase
MLNLPTLLKPWKEAGSLHDHIPFWGWVDNHTLLTKAGDVCTFLRVPGIDFECIGDGELETYTKRFEASLKLLDPEWRLYQLLFRHNDPAIPRRQYPDRVVDAAIGARARHFERRRTNLYGIDIFYVLLHHARSRRTEALTKKVQALFGTSAQADLIEREIDEARKRLAERVHAFTQQLADFLPTRVLGRAEAHLVLRRLLNPDPRKAAGPGLKYDTHVDFYTADSHIETYRNHLRFDDYFVRVVTLKQAPSTTWPLILKQLYELPANLHVVTEWHALTTEAAKKVITTSRRHHHTAKTSLVSHMQDAPNPNDILVDTSKSALVDSLNAAATDMEMRGAYFGEYTLSVVVYDLDRDRLERAVGEIYKTFAAHDAAIYEERYNLLDAYWSTLPGNYHHNRRRWLLTNANAADLAFIFSLSQGEPRNEHLRDEALALFETQHRTLYHLNLHVHDIGHSLVLGKTGSGKSFLLNFLAANAQKYAPHTFFFDLGGSFKGITRLFGGTYLRIGVQAEEDPLAPEPVRINPFSLEPTPNNLEFLGTFLRVLIEGPDYQLTVADDRELTHMVTTLYALDPESRTLRNYSNLLPRHLAERLHRWVHGAPDGQYAFLFDNEWDTLELARFLCVDFEGLDRYPHLVEPLLFYLLHRANAVIHDPALARVLKLFFIDEAWRFFRHPAIARYIVEALKTWRKRNAAMVLSTQSVDDLMKSDLLEVLVESCGTKIFLANPSLNEDLYRDVLKLPPQAIDLIRGLRPKGQLLVSKPSHTKVLNLDVDPRSYWLYTNDPNDNAHRDEAIKKYGFERGLDHLEHEGALR